MNFRSGCSPVGHASRIGSTDQIGAYRAATVAAERGVAGLVGSAGRYEVVGPAEAEKPTDGRDERDAA